MFRFVRKYAGSGRRLAASITEHAEHWYVSLRVEITAPRRPVPRAGVVGVDMGIGDHLLVVMRPDGAEEEKVPNPPPLCGASW